MKKTTFFKDKVIIITGASSGIGMVSAVKLSRLGAKVVLAARDEKRLAELENQISISGHEVLSIKTDVSIKQDVVNLINRTMDKWGRIDIYISNAGQYVQGLIKDINEEDFRRSFAVNFYGSFYAVQVLLPVMFRQKSGHIVLINTLDSKKGIVGDGPYVAAKNALDGFGDVLRQEVKKMGIKVLTVYPARVDTQMIQDLKVPWVSPKISAEKVADNMIRAIYKNKAIQVVPKSNALLGALNSLFPKMMDWIYQRFKIEGVRKV